MAVELVKENPSANAALSAWWLAVALGFSVAALLLAALADSALPAPKGPEAAPTEFQAHNAYNHLLNLTAIGPRVAGSYENEVLAVAVVSNAVRAAAAAAGAHNTVEIDLHSSSGAFDLDFFDGLNNIYSDVQSVVVRVRAAGAPPPPRRDALLLNCHYDTVPGSPGASDDGAGCAVVLEVIRALAARRTPLARPVLALLNGAEENIMQASHGFVSSHRWARQARAFINLEACGAGGREVLFQAGPKDPWLVQQYAHSVPYPFASSLAQELFESGLIPADTDFRVFRDFGNLSGVDLAWSAHGYVYHTALDTAHRVPMGTLQRTGDNVLALVLGLLSEPGMSVEPEPQSSQPVFFDVLGLGVVVLQVQEARLLAVVAVLLTIALIHRDARHANKELYMTEKQWWWGVWRALVGGLCAGGAGVGGAGLMGALTHVGAPLAYYSRPWLLGPLYAAPAVAGALAAGRWMRAGGGGGAPLRGGWAWRRAGGALAGGWGAGALLCALRGLRSGFVPLLPALLSPAAGLLTPRRASLPLRAAIHVAAWTLPLLQLGYLAVSVLQTFVPLTGRAGTPTVPVDAVLATIVASLTLAALSWATPVAAAAGRGRAVRCLLLAAVLVATLAAVSDPYSASRPQRLMVFHTRRWLHAEGEDPTPTSVYWMPELDANTPRTLAALAGPLSASLAPPPQECSRWVYCGAPYYLPVLGLVTRGLSAPAPHPPQLSADVSLTIVEVNATSRELQLNVSCGSHGVVVVSPAAGVALVSVDALPFAPRPARPWGSRRTYFLTLHRAHSSRQPWALRLLLATEGGVEGPGAGQPWAQVSVAAHKMGSPPEGALRRLLSALPPTLAATGWEVDLHLYEV